MHALLLISAIICQYGTTETLMRDYEDPGFTTSLQGNIDISFSLTLLLWTFLCFTGETNYVIATTENARRLKKIYKMNWNVLRLNGKLILYLLFLRENFCKPILEFNFCRACTCQSSPVRGSCSETIWQLWSVWWWSSLLTVKGAERRCTPIV